MNLHAQGESASSIAEFDRGQEYASELRQGMAEMESNPVVDLAAAVSDMAAEMTN